MFRAAGTSNSFPSGCFLPRRWQDPWRWSNLLCNIAWRALGAKPAYALMTSERVTSSVGYRMNFGGQQMVVFAVLLASLLMASRRRASNDRI